MGRVKEGLDRLQNRILRHPAGPGYFELISQNIKFKDASMDLATEVGVNQVDLSKIVILSTLKAKYERQIGPYIISHYTEMFEQLYALKLQISKEGVQSRRFMIQFNKEHCFQSIQFLVREDTVYVITTMRSCNFKKNFGMDLMLSIFCGQYVQWITGRNKMHVTMNIGSLHIFTEEE